MMLLVSGCIDFEKIEAYEKGLGEKYRRNFFSPYFDP